MQLGGGVSSGVKRFDALKPDFSKLGVMGGKGQPGSLHWIRVDPKSDPHMCKTTWQCRGNRATKWEPCPSCEARDMLNAVIEAFQALSGFLNLFVPERVECFECLSVSSA